MEKTLKKWFTASEAPVIGQDSVRTYLLISILVIMVLAAIFGPLTDIVPLEDLW